MPIVLGGGISGLSYAYYLSRAMPSARIVLVEKSARVGGWVQTDKTCNDCIFEAGPRTLRPVGEAGAITLELVHALGLADQILTVPFSSPAAKNRYILNGDRIHAMPSSISGLVKAMYSNHILKGSFMSFVKEPFVGKTAKADESIHEFISRRFSPELANRMISALVHGIYAGNVENLSVRSTFKQLWDWEQSHGSIIRGIFMSALCEKPRSLQEYIQPNAISFIESVRNNCSIYSFKDGLQTLTDGLYRELKSRSNVEILTETECIEINGVVDGVQSFSPPSQPSVKLRSVSTNKTHQLKTDQIVSTLPAHAAARLLPNELSVMLDRIKSVDVAVVNLAFEGSSVLPVDGFGYLVPATENTGVLGTVFDSCAMPLQNSRPDTTRLTVMLGGHKFSKYYNCENVDNLEKYFLSIALDTVRNHLGINIKPLAHKVHIHRQCIPQYQVGHTQLTSEIKSWLANHCSGRLELLGSSFNGVSVNDCIKTAREIATS